MMKKDLIEITTSLLGGAGIGAALMYLMDPESGSYRREHITDAAGNVISSARDAVRHTGSGVSESLSNAMSSLSDHARALKDDMSDYASETGHSARKSARRLSSRARQYVPSMMSDDDEHSSMGTGAAVTLTALSALALGAGLMYVMDPSSGRRRRAVIRDKAAKYAHETTDTLAGTAEDLSNRARGLYYKGRRQARNMMPGHDAGQEPGSGQGERPLGAVEEHGHRVMPSQIGGV